MQKSLHVLLLTSPDDAHSSVIYKIFSAYNQNVFPYNNSEELPICINDKTPLGSVLSKGVKLLRICASLADITLTTLHPAVIYPVPVSSAAHAELFDEACMDGARAISLGLISRMVTCIGKGSISDILSAKDATYEKLFGTPAWLAILQCYCSGVLSWLHLFTISMSNQQGTHNATLLNEKDFQGTPTYGNNAVSLAFGPLTMSTPVREHLTSTMSLDAVSSIDSPSQTDLASNITLRIIKTLELVINQAIRTYVRVQSAAPLVAMVAHAEVLPYEEIPRAPLYLVYPSSKDRNNLQEISRLLLPDASTNTSPVDILNIDQKRSLLSTKYASNKSILYQESHAQKDLLLSRHIITDQNTESKAPKRARSKGRKLKTTAIKKHSTIVCWESVSIGQCIPDSYVEASNFIDVQLQMMIGGIPIKDSKKRKTLALKNLCILNTWHAVDISSANMFLCALKAYTCIYSYTYYRFVKQNGIQVPDIEHCASSIGDGCKWYTTSSQNWKNLAADWNKKALHNHSLSTKDSSVRTTEQGLLTSNKAASISTAANQGSITRKHKTCESTTDLNIKQSKPQVIILTESSTMDDRREGSHADSTSQNVRGWRSTYHEDKTQSELQSCTSLSTSTTDIHNTTGYTGTHIVPEAPSLQHFENIGANLDVKHHLTSSQAVNMFVGTKSKRFNIYQSIRKSNSRTNRETRQRANSTVDDRSPQRDTNTHFISTHNPEYPCQLPVSCEYIQEQYLHTFIGVNAAAGDVVVRPEASLQPYIRLPSTSADRRDYREAQKYIPSELAKKYMPSSSSKALHDGNQREVRIISKKPLIVQLDKLSAPMVTQALTIKKSTNDVILIAVFHNPPSS